MKHLIRDVAGFNFTQQQFDNEVEIRVAEGRRVGKNPWCCSACVEEEAYRRLNWQTSPRESYPQETFLESQERWCGEGVITKERLKEIKDQGKTDKKAYLLLSAMGALRELAKMERET